MTTAGFLRMPAGHLLVCGVLLLNSFAFPSATAQDYQSKIQVKEWIWGFDGRVAAAQFNPLSILLDNLSADAYELTLTLNRNQGVLTKSGGQQIKTVFLGGQSRVWVQFYPFVANSFGAEWTITARCDDPEFEFELTRLIEPRASNVEANRNKNKSASAELPQAIILDQAGRASNIPVTVKHFPENQFPPFSTVTHALHTVFLDHMPDWEYPRQEAFIAWLKRGGQLFVLQDSRGQIPEFSERLVELNRPQQSFDFGSGHVFVRDFQRNELTEARFQSAMAQSERRGDKQDEEIVNTQMQALGEGYLNFADSSINDTIFREMRENTFPEHSWFLILLLAITYVGLIFPGCFVLSKKRTIHYAATYGAIIGSAFLFSLLFLFVGRRGYGEETNLQTLAVATAIDNDRWDIFQWNAFFVVNGDTYLAEAPAEQTIFASANSYEVQAINVFPGRDGRAEMKVPPYASQTFVCRRFFEGALGRVKIQSISRRDSGLVELQLKPNADFDFDGIHKCSVLMGKHVYRLTVDKKSEVLRLQGKKQPLKDFLVDEFQEGYFQSPWMAYDDDLRSDEEIFYDGALTALVRRSLWDITNEKINRYALPTNRIRLFVYRDLPEQLSLTMSAPTKSIGRVLVVQDLFPDRLSDMVSMSNQELTSPPDVLTDVETSDE